MLVYKQNVMKMLKNAGYSSYKLERSYIFSSTELQKMRRGVVVGIKSLERLCTLLHCQPGDLIAWVADDAQDDDSPAL